jgi:outer membrane protein
MITQKLLSIINTILIITVIIIAILFYTEYKKEKPEDIAYVDNSILFNEFNMTKEIKYIEQKKIIAIKQPMDSIYAIYQKLANKNSSKGRALELELNKRSQLLEELQDNYTNNLTQKVWGRLNNYLSIYAEENNKKIIFGTSSSGNIMYAKKSIDLTSSVLAFCNKKYEGNLFLK